MCGNTGRARGGAEQPHMDASSATEKVRARPSGHEMLLSSEAAALERVREAEASGFDSFTLTATEEIKRRKEKNVKNNIFGTDLRQKKLR